LKNEITDEVVIDFYGKFEYWNIANKNPDLSHFKSLHERAVIFKNNLFNSSLAFFYVFLNIKLCQFV